ncbi:MAG: hypothetical protein OXI39_09120 [Gemmatimonadota bacterium]|uniref:hypothetical protein n=1 Tax=Candidatus Palauibacter scopulicola TaxID=3056741 RepID=UPI0023A624BD|nr:hypothetical protein [Candidatus Palauibacter scopulicola]MDE2663147.1 hypothetical protein [Candidatus Palauibacter scopulicola]
MGFDVIGLITLVLAIIGVGVKLELGNRKLGGRVDRLGDELRSEIGDVRREIRDTRAELRGEIKDVRDKLGSEIGALRAELAKTSTSVARLEGHAFGIPFPDTGGGRGVGQG